MGIFCFDVTDSFDLVWSISLYFLRAIWWFFGMLTKNFDLHSCIKQIKGYLLQWNKNCLESAKCQKWHKTLAVVLITIPTDVLVKVSRLLTGYMTICKPHFEGKPFFVANWKILFLYIFKNSRLQFSVLIFFSWI